MSLPDQHWVNHTMAVVHKQKRQLNEWQCSISVGLPLGLEAPVMTPSGVIFHFFSMQHTYCPCCGLSDHGIRVFCCIQKEIQPSINNTS